MNHLKTCLTAAVLTIGSLQAAIAETDFSGTVSIGLRGKNQHCSGSLVRFKGAPDSNKGLVLTAGHCIKTGNYLSTYPERPDIGQLRVPRPNEILVNFDTATSTQSVRLKDHVVKIKKYSPEGNVSEIVDLEIENADLVINRNASIEIQLLNREGEDVEKVSTNKLLYATFSGTDVAIYELPLTYKEIEQSFGIKALVLSKIPPTRNDLFYVVTGLEKAPHKVRDIYNCQIDKIIPRVQGGDWTFNENYRYVKGGECDEMFDPGKGSGTSGSPMISVETGEVFGIHTGGNLIPQGGLCTLMRHCEIIETVGGQLMTIDNPLTLYGKQTYKLYTCIDENFQIDLNIDGCEMPKPPVQN